MSEADYSQFKSSYTEATGVDDPIELSNVFSLSNSIKDVLVPVNAASFKASLRRRIESRPRVRSRFQRFTQPPRFVWIAVAATTSLLSITGVVLIVIKRFKSSTEPEQAAAVI